MQTKVNIFFVQKQTKGSYNLVMFHFIERIAKNPLSFVTAIE